MEQSDKDADVAYKQRQNNFQVTQIALSAAGLVILFAYTTVTYLLYDATRHRAALELSSITMNRTLVAEQEIGFTISMLNVGDAAATEIAPIGIYMAIPHPSERPEFWAPDDDAPVIYGVAGKGQLWTTATPKTFIERDVEDILNGTKLLYVYGTIRYNNGVETTKSTFCRLFVPKMSDLCAIPPPSSNWVTPPPELIWGTCQYWPEHPTPLPNRLFGRSK